MKTKFLLFICLFLTIKIVAQSKDIIVSKFESFQYDTVIQMVNNRLNADTSLSSSDRIQLIEMKAISFFSISEMDSAEATFIELLSLDPNFRFNPVRTSPKIIEHFNSIKSVFNKVKTISKQKESGVSDKGIIKSFDSDAFSTSLAKSIVLPGLGHISNQSSTKGWLITIFGTANLASMVYYIVETNNREKKYLNETDLSKIESKYNSYNSSYKTRNILIGTFAAIWVFSQLDLIFNKDEYFVNTTNTSFSISHNEFGQYYKLNFSIQL
jgi:hypothetical protein